MTSLKDKRPAAIRVVIPFVFRHGLQQPGRAAIVTGGLLGATTQTVSVNAPDTLVALSMR